MPWDTVSQVRDPGPVKGFRLNLIYGVNQDMTGFDIGLGNHAKGNMSRVALIAKSFL